MLVLLLVWYWLWLFWGVRPHLIYLINGPIFQNTVDFALACARTWGGPGRWLGALLAQGDHHDALGALLRVAQAALIGLLAQRLADRLAARPAPWVRYVAVVPYLLLCGRLDQPAAAGVMAIGLLSVGLLLARCVRRGPLARLGLSLLLAALLTYALAGAAGRAQYWPFQLGAGLLIGLVEWRHQPARGRLAGLVGMLLLAGLGSAWLPGPGLHAPPPPTRLTSVLVALLWLSGPLGLMLASRRRPADTAATSVAAVRPALALALGLLALQLAAVRTWAGQALAEQATADQLRLGERWDAIIARTPPGQPLDPLVLNDVDMALAHRGRLIDELFRYPQTDRAVMLPINGPYTVSYRLRLADQFLALGRVNAAEYALHNALPYTGDNPYLLRRLVTVYQLKGDQAAARVYLGLLSHDLVHGGWARRRLAAMAQGGPDSGGLTELRRRMLQRDDLVEVTYAYGDGGEVSYYRDVPLVHQLERDPSNALALQLLVSIELLAGRSEQLPDRLRYLRSCGFDHIPAPWEEALLLRMSRVGRIDLHGWTISEASQQRFERFSRLLASGGDLKALWPAIAREFPDSYLAFITYTRMNQ